MALRHLVLELKGMNFYWKFSQSDLVNKNNGCWNPPSLLLQSMGSLLKEDEWAIAALECLPAQLFPLLFKEAFAQKRCEIVKAIVQLWPFLLLPLGFFLDYVNITDKFCALLNVLDGIDILLLQKVQPRRCKLKMLDLSYTAQKFCSQRCHTEAYQNPSKTWRLVIDESSRKMHRFSPLEVVLKIGLIYGKVDELNNAIVQWAAGRKNIHLCVGKMNLVDEPFQDHDMDFIQLNCIQEAEATFVLRKITCATFSPLLGQMTRLQRLSLKIRGLECICPEKQEDRAQLVSELSSQLLRLHSLEELFVDSLFFLKGQLDKVLRALRTPHLRSLSLLHCPLLEGDLAHLCHCPNLTRLKALSLRGTNLSVVGERLRVLLENCAATLQDLDLGVCGLRDSHLQAILPGLKVCSQLRTLNLLGNRMSMTVLVQVLRQLAGLPHLIMELYPAPWESYKPLNRIHQRTFDLLCEELLGVLRELGTPRSILVSVDLCSYCGRIIFCHGEPTLMPLCCRNSLIQKISYGNSGEKGVSSFEV